jgi:hypothetical protein
LLLAIIASCKKQVPSVPLSFDVTAANNNQQVTNTFKVNDTVNFVFSGNPDRVTFFSGEVGHRYDYRDRVTDTSTNVGMTFTSAQNTVGTSGKMSLLVSTDFAGYAQNNSIDSVNVAKATWTDISSRALFATNATSKASGAVNLSDYAKSAKPLFIALKYTAIANTTQSKWTISGIGVKHKTVDTTFVIDSSALVLPTAFPAYAVSPGWGTVNVANNTIKFSPAITTTAATSFVVTGATTAATAVATENWIITGPLDLHRVLPDAGIAVKDMTSNASTTIYGSPNAFTAAFANYSYKFTKRGTYNVTFLVSNSNVSKDNASVKTLQIVIK